ncbi:MAG: hypothetical protein WBK26_05300 [Burkholderiaceae bacterium]
MNTATQPTTDQFSAFFLEDESTVEITLPNGEPMLYPATADGAPVVVVVYGPSTPQFAAAKEKVEKAATQRVFAAMGKPGKKSREPAADEADIAYLVAVTKRIDNFPFPGGPEAVYSDKRLQYVANQVRAHLADLGNFFKPSTTN